jgi:predicted CoA-substrate-specific enzyme activase
LDKKAYFVGIDVGSLSTNAVIIDTQKEIIAYEIIDTGANSTEAAECAYQKVLKSAGLHQDAISCIVATGYGRVSVPFAHKTLTEISCHGMGAHHLFPKVRTVIDIGGQDSKVIRINQHGRVQDFIMNDKCAAGTGRFLEVMASKLQVPLEKMGAVSLQAKNEAKISSVCTVSAESEVVSLAARNHPTSEIIQGIHRAIVNRVGSMVQSVGVARVVTMTGGVAKNSGVVALMAQKVGFPIRVYTEPQIVGALGAALMARKLPDKGA